MSVRKIAAATGVPKSTVQDHLKAPTSRTRAKSQRGRRHKIDTDTIEKMIASLQGHYNERIKPWHILRRDWKLNCTDQTLANAFARHGFHKCKACQKGIMSPLNIARRQEFAEIHKDKDEDYWKRVVFTDEIHFARNNRSVDYVIRAPGQRFCSDCIQIRRQKTKTEYSVWAAVGWNFKSPLIFYGKTGIQGGFTGEDYLRDCLKGFIEPTFAQACNKHRILQEDNDGAHGTKTNNNPNAIWKQEHYINCLKWPPQSPDLSPIENVWRILKSRVRARNAHNKVELRSIILEEWDRITQDEINALIESMPTRIKICRLRKGFSTPF